MTTTTPATITTGTAVDRLLEIVVAARPATDPGVYAPDARLDAVVPGWRFPLAGAARIAEQFAKWFAFPGALEELERHPTPTGEVVTYTVTWEVQGVPHAARHAHVLTIEDDRITLDQMWCGGQWPAPLLAEMEAARHDG